MLVNTLIEEIPYLDVLILSSIIIVVQYYKVLYSIILNKIV